MSGVPIEMYVPLAIPPAHAREAVREVVERIAANGMSYHALKLTLHPGGSVEPRWEFPITLVARTAERFFPTFEGSLIVTPLAEACELWLQGSYTPPLGQIGSQFDATVLRGAAQSSLRGFLQSFADDVKLTAASSEA
jgi:hypothetical protein